MMKSALVKLFSKVMGTIEKLLQESFQLCPDDSETSDNRVNFSCPEGVLHLCFPAAVFTHRCLVHLAPRRHCLVAPLMQLVGFA